ncbi:MAG: hypothetical protein ABI035_07220 [Gemmatimonadaceae bacterium]
MRRLSTTPGSVLNCGATLLISAFVVACGESPTGTSSQLVAAKYANSPDLGTMAVGNVRVLTFADASNGLTIPSSLASAQYVIVAANVAGDTGSVPQYTVSGDHVGSPIPSAEVAAVQSPFIHPQYTRVGGLRGAQFEARLRSYERTRLHSRGATVNMQSNLRRADNVPVGTVPKVGEQYQFNVPGNGDDVCVGYSTVTATVEAVSSYAIIMTDNRALNSGFTAAAYDSIGTEFDTYVYPTETGYFGAPTDIDHNGHVFILFTPAVNQLTPPGDAKTHGFVGGYTFAGDFLPSVTEANGGCPESNEAEMFYMLVPDSTASGGSVYGNVFSVASVEQQTRATIAHELQHAINSGNRFVNNYNFESAWLDEALSSMAEDNVGRAELASVGQSYGDLSTITLNDLQKTNGNLVETFFLENFERTQQYVTRPDTVGPLVNDKREESDLAAFGAGWAFLRYTADWFSNSSPRTLTRALVAGPDTGQVNLTKHAGAPLDTLLAHWLVTMYTDGEAIPGLAAQYSYRSYSMRDIVSNLCADETCTAPTYLPVHSLGSGSSSVTIGVPSSSADYFITDQSTGGARTVRISSGAAGGVAANSSGRLYVIRVK